MSNDFSHACGCIETAISVSGGMRTHFSKICNYHQNT